MSSERLREAATLMRERANEAVADSDGVSVWRLGPRNNYGSTPTIVQDLTDDPDPYTVATGLTDADAEHIASWHPAVALAVADWLDGTATDTPWDFRHDEALAVANAYLGGDD